MVGKMVPGKLLIETTGYNDLEYLTEGVGDRSSKKYFIKGAYMQANVKNRNGRIYEGKILFPEVDRFNKEKVLTRRATGALDHPLSNSTVLLKDACHLITELKIDGDIVYGKSEVLDTDTGRTLKVLMDANVQVAISTRGVGSLTETGIVGDNFRLLTADVVQDPSCQIAFVESVFESQDYIIQNDQLIAVNMETLKKDLAKNGSKNLYNDINSFLTRLSRKL